MKEKEQTHTYTLEELDEAIGDDDSEEDGPEYYFIDREVLQHDLTCLSHVLLRPRWPVTMKTRRRASRE